MRVILYLISRYMPQRAVAAAGFYRSTYVPSPPSMVVLVGFSDLLPPSSPTLVLYMYLCRQIRCAPISKQQEPFLTLFFKKRRTFLAVIVRCALFLGGAAGFCICLWKSREAVRGSTTNFNVGLETSFRKPAVRLDKWRGPVERFQEIARDTSVYGT